MKVTCSHCGQKMESSGQENLTSREQPEEKPKVAVPDERYVIMTDCSGTDIMACKWCGEFIYRTDEETEWLHVKSECRSCDDE